MLKAASENFRFGADLKASSALPLATSETMRAASQTASRKTQIEHNPMATKKANPSWSDVKAKLIDLDRDDLLELVHDIYAASKDNRAFLHARLRLDVDVLKPYKAKIDRWLWPDVLQQQDTSVAKAKKAIADYRRADGTGDGSAELMVFYCEQAAGFSADVCLDDENYFAALVWVFGQALKTIAELPSAQRSALRVRLDAVHDACDGMGYGVYEDVADLLAKHWFHD